MKPLVKISQHELGSCRSRASAAKRKGGECPTSSEARASDRARGGNLGFPQNKAYSLIELIIVIAIILVLASAAIIGSQTIIKSLRLNNAFNKVVFMVQQARNLAITAKNTFSAPVTQYEVRFYLDATTGPQKIEIFAKGPDQIIETYTFDAASGLSLFANDYRNASEISCAGATFTTIAFEQTTAKTNINCPGTTPPDTPILQIRVQGQNNNQKTFLFQRGAGIPQIQ